MDAIFCSGTHHRRGRNEPALPTRLARLRRRVDLNVAALPQFDSTDDAKATRQSAAEARLTPRIAMVRRPTLCRTIIDCF